MTEIPIAAVIMAAGLGTRMRSAVPKHFHVLLGRRVVDWVILAARDAGADRVVVVCSPSAADASNEASTAGALSSSAASGGK